MPQAGTRWDVTRLGAIFEGSPGLLSRLLPRLAMTDSPKGVLAKASAIVETLDERERIAILSSHPRIGDAVGASALSRREQGADADRTTLGTLAALNDAYERRFGFRCVVFVNGRSKADIVPVLRERLENDRQAELATGIREFLAICGDRLERAMAPDAEGRP